MKEGKHVLFLVLFFAAIMCPVFAGAQTTSGGASQLEPLPMGQPGQGEPALLEEEPPIGREETSEQEGVGGEVFGRTGGYIHPYCAVTEIFSDNIYRTPNNEEEGFATILSPGIWFALPRTKKKVLALDTSSSSPGGIRLSRERSSFFRRYQAYLLYGADFEFYGDSAAEDAESHRVEGLFQYNFRGGLSIDVIDQFEKSHDARGSGISSVRLDEYTNNLFNTVLTYDLTEKILLRGDYQNYNVDYDDVRNFDRDRTDEAWAGYLFFKVTPKTAVFGEYEFVDIDYEAVNSTQNSEEEHVYLGLQWNMTAKTKGMIKAGWGSKDFESAAIKDSDNVILETQVQHNFSAKTQVLLFAKIVPNETDITTADYVDSSMVSGTYVQHFTNKMTGRLSVSYANNDYQGVQTYDGIIQERQDDIFAVAPTLLYDFKDWLEGSVGYIYSNRDSNFSRFDYTDNTVFIKLAVSF